MDLIFDKIDDGYKIIYLCAHVHNFQFLTVKKGDNAILPIIVSGTGGGDPEILTTVHHMPTYKGMKGYTVTLHKYEHPYGYCIIDGTHVTYNTFNCKAKKGIIKEGSMTVGINYLQEQL